VALITDAPARRVIGLRGVAQLMAQINLVGESLGADGGRLFLNCPIIPGQGHYRTTVWPISQSLSFLLYCQSFLRGDLSMTQETVQIVAGVLLAVIIGILIMRRKGKKKQQEDEF
jgi:hypothetical protein